MSGDTFFAILVGILLALLFIFGIARAEAREPDFRAQYRYHNLMPMCLEFTADSEGYVTWIRKCPAGWCEREAVLEGFNAVCKPYKRDGYRRR